VVRLGDGVGNVGEPLAGSHGRGQAPPLRQGQAATLSRHRAGSLVLCESPCAALDVAPPDEPPERTSGTVEGSEALGH
jgi:hypothetical protein